MSDSTYPTYPTTAGGLGFGMYVAVELTLVVDVLPDPRSAAKDLGVFNFAGAVPFSLAPAVASAILAVGDGGTACCTSLRGPVPC